MKKVCVRVSVETEGQFEAVLEAERADLIYIDSGTFAPGEWKDICRLIHEKGMEAGLRMPFIFRKRASDFFDSYLKELSEAGFDRLLCRNLESVGYLKDRGVSMPISLDHNVYDFNSLTEEILEELTGIADFELTLPLELSKRELSELSGSSRHKRELVVYGRAPMMVSAQCVHAAESGCDRKPGLKLITDRTGRHLPVRNYCSFCYNVIYNFAPTVLSDLENELSAIDHQSRRYEFTVESREETLKILRNDIKYKENEFTRGWFRRGAE